MCAEDARVHQFIPIKRGANGAPCGMVQEEID